MGFVKIYFKDKNSRDSTQENLSWDSSWYFETINDTAMSRWEAGEYFSGGFVVAILELEPKRD